MALMLIGVAIYYTESMLRQGFTVRGVFIVLLAVSLAIHTLYVSITWFVSGEYHDYTGEKSKQCDNCSLYYKNAWSYQFLRLNIPLLRVTWFGGGFCLYGKSEVQENGFRLISKQPSEMFKKKRYAMLPTGIMTTLTFKNKLIISPLKRKKAFL